MTRFNQRMTRIQAARGQAAPVIVNPQTRQTVRPMANTGSNLGASHVPRSNVRAIRNPLARQR